LPALARIKSVVPALRLALITLVLFGSGAISLANSALSGRVRDEGGGSLPGVTILAHKLSGEKFDQSTKTDDQGRYSFGELPDGEYSVKAGVRGFVSVLYEPVRIYFPAQVRCDFALEVADVGEGGVYASSEVVGELLVRGARVACARICLRRVDGPDNPVCTTTNRLGQYFLDVPTGVYTVTVERGGRTWAGQQLDMRTAGEYRNKVTLDADQ
jgi:hypothetical protein